jgi:two-component system phosphate regulon sensor histidine kinase PhoR
MTEAARALAEGRTEPSVPLDPPAELAEMGRALGALREELTRRRQEVHADVARLHAILSAMQDGVVALGADGRVEITNAAARRLLGLPGPMNQAEVWELTRDEGAVAAVRRALGGAEGHAALEHEGRTLEIDAAPVASGGAVVAVRDVTRRQEYDRLRREFVANVSHELRTPLTLIRGFVETLRAGALEDPPKAREFLETIDRHAGRLSALIEDLLELSRLESQPGILKRRRVRLDELLQRVRETFAPAARRAGLRLLVEAPPLEAEVDPELAERAVANLVDNALKYTPQGGSVSLTACAPAVIEVRDTGVGIPGADLAHVFERFYRVEKSRSRELGGTGLGLAIVKHVAQLHGGGVEVESEPGRGSRFRISLGPASPPAGLSASSPAG